ncbi:hypothetical protein AaE_009432 [Aphanomyces astaci]|uniref:Uncharacterized protein n=1 Tax=Aphanomyces astaci TaxID=112090 RepID=A0A6A5A383_APHAT|nr:hypothetical protein AaE_009432 [Aphanomyces astaci]
MMATEPDAAAVQPMDALFVLQIIIDAIHLHRQCVSGELAWVRLGFQLLSFNVVVLDAEIPLTVADGNGDELTGQVRKGKSCMFRMHADALMDAMEASPLSLMVLETPTAAATGQLTRLLAFTCIDMPRRERFNHEAATMREWVNIQNSWTVYNHAGDAVGLVQGGVVLSHLGSSLAPHLQHALGAVHVTDSSTDAVDMGSNQPTTVVHGIGVMTETIQVEKVEAGVQCDAESCQVETVENPRIVEAAVDCDDVFIARRPPPLFFQREALSPKESRPIKHGGSMAHLMFTRE